MCHDERLLNLWIKDLLLLLDYISGLPRYVFKSHFQTTFEYKSGYDHVKLSPDSFTFVGLEWKGWYWTLPFGWKASAYIYHMVSLVATSCPLSWCPLQSICWWPPCRPTHFTLRSSRFSQVVKFSACPGCCFLLCVQFWFSLDTSLANSNLFLFLRLESGFWVFCLIPSFKLSLFHKIRESSLPPFVTPFSSIEQRPSRHLAIRRQGYLFLFSCPGCLVICEKFTVPFLWQRVPLGPSNLLRYLIPR